MRLAIALAAVALAMGAVGATAHTPVTTGSRECSCMPGRLVYRTTIADTLPEFINTGDVMLHTVPLDARVRPGHPWSISSVSLNATISASTSATSRWTTTIGLIVAGQEFILTSRADGGSQGRSFADQVTSAAFDVEWTDSILLFIRIDPSDAAGENVFSYASGTFNVGLFGSVQ